MVRDADVGDWGSAQRVYVIGEVAPAGGARRVKIGISVDPQARLRSLQTGSSRALELLASGPGGQTLERRLHRVFAGAHVHGEWFELDPVSLASLCEVVSRPHAHLDITRGGVGSRTRAPSTVPPAPRRSASQTTWTVAIIGFLIFAASAPYLLVVPGVVMLLMAAVARSGSWAAEGIGRRVVLGVAGAALIAGPLVAGSLFDAEEPRPALAEDDGKNSSRPQERAPKPDWAVDGPCGVDGDGWSPNC